MESARVRYLRTIFLIQKQRERKPHKALSMLKFAYFILAEIFTFNVFIKFICFFIQRNSSQGILFLYSKVQALFRFFETLAKE